MDRKIFILLLLAALTQTTLNTYCSSTCIDYTGACFDETPQGCWVCADHVYNIISTIGATDPCSVKNQVTVLAKELPNTAMSLFGYTSTNPTPFTCTNYTFSGEYTANDYIYKNFTGIPLNHYALVVRFNVGYIGIWDTTDVLRLNLQDSKDSVNYDYNFSCAYPENICGQIGNATDCIKIREYTMTHNTSYVFLNFSALTSETDPLVQKWGIKQLIVAAKLCHPYCETCYGGANSNCLSCASGYYLQGNVCLPTCDMGLYKITDQRLCATTCPSSYFGTVNSTDSTKICSPCQSGCLVCSNLDTCQAWQNQSAYTPDLWRDKLQFWILLIIVICAVLFIVIYKIVKAAIKPSPSKLEEKLNSGDQQNSNQNGKSKSKKSRKEGSDQSRKDQVKSQAKMNLASKQVIAESIVLPDSKLWFNELVELEPNEVKITKPRRRRRSPPGSQHQNSMTDAQQVGGSNGDL